MFYSCMSFKKDNGMKCIKIENKTVFWHVPAGNHRVLVLSPKSWPTEPNGTIIQVITITCGSWTAAPLPVSCSLVLRPYFTRKYSFCWRILSNITPVHNYDNCGKRDVIKKQTRVYMFASIKYFVCFSVELCVFPVSRYLLPSSGRWLIVQVKKRGKNLWERFRFSVWIQSSYWQWDRS